VRGLWYGVRHGILMRVLRSSSRGLDVLQKLFVTCELEISTLGFTQSTVLLSSPPVTHPFNSNACPAIYLLSWRLPSAIPMSSKTPLQLMCSITRRLLSVAACLDNPRSFPFYIPVLSKLLSSPGDTKILSIDFSISHSRIDTPHARAMRATVFN